jgi:hypothetical protein
MEKGQPKLWRSIHMMLRASLRLELMFILMVVRGVF